MFSTKITYTVQFVGLDFRKTNGTMSEEELERWLRKETSNVYSELHYSSETVGKGIHFFSQPGQERRR